MPGRSPISTTTTADPTLYRNEFKDVVLDVCSSDSDDNSPYTPEKYQIRLGYTREAMKKGSITVKNLFG